MTARNAFVSPSKPILFKTVEINEDASDEIKSAIQTTNEFIEFINFFRYRPTEPFDKDIEKRESLVKYLCHPDKQEELRNKVFPFFYCQRMPMLLAREKEKLLINVFDEFKKYAKFAHLTATELVVVTIAIQKLISFLQFTQKQTKNVILQEQIRHQLNVLMESQEAIYLCMRKHQSVFDKNQSIQDLPSNDILLETLNEIDSLTGADCVARWSLTPDKSLLLAVPELPFGDMNELKTAKHYFDVCHEVHLANQGQWLNRAIGIIGKTTEWTRWGLQGAWWLSQAAVTAPLKMFGNGAKLTTSVAQDVWKQGKKVVGAIPVPNLELPLINTKEEPSDSTELYEMPHLNAMSQDLHSYAEKLTRLADKGVEAQKRNETFAVFKDEIQNRINQLEVETQHCNKSIFRFFMKHEIEKKTIKAKSLLEVLAATDLSEIKALAKMQMESENKDIILAGRHSRTRETLEKIVGMKYA